MGFTKAQEKAITLNRKSILVSAAAGSGKTTVLTARIMRMLLDEAAPLSLSDMLIVTYTKAAAAELKVKIRRELQKEIVKHPQNKHLASQLFAVQNAQISTIHSFCYQLIKEHFQELGLCAKLKIMDYAEKALLCDDIMNEVINAYYNGDYQDGFDFSQFADTFLRERDEHLAKEWIDRYEKLCAYAKGLSFLREFAASLREGIIRGFANTAWGEEIIQYLRRDIAQYLRIYQEALALFETEAAYQKKHYPAFFADSCFLKELDKHLEEKDFPHAFRCANDYLSQIPELKGVRLGDLKTDEVVFFCEIRDSFKSMCRSLGDLLLLCCDGVNEALLEQSAAHYEALYCVLTRFEVRLNAEKKERGLLDYGDLERHAITLLYDEHGAPSDIARAVSEKYKEVFIDEYQDVNETQDLIFRAICQNTHAFMVGDIKQSIYQFRGADPTFFSDYRDAYRFYDVDADTDGGTQESETTLFLSNNFRCDKNIIDTVNLIFESLFRHNSNKVPYYDADALVYSKLDAGEPHKVKVCVLEQPQKQDTKSSDSVSRDVEALYVASEIQRLLAEGIEPGEIAILSRDMKHVAPRYEEVFTQYGIPLQTQASVSFLDYPEIKLVLSLLHVLDNPAKDIDLAAVLLSPLFAFTMDELIEIRAQENHKGSLYLALTEYVAQHTEFEKGTFFLQALSQYRNYATGQSVDKILWYLYHETRLLYLVSQNTTSAAAQGAKKRLLMLYDYARQFEATSFCGLYRFLYYLENVIAKEQELPSEGDDAQKNAVQLLTFHKSKGLEYKVCFVVNCAKNFSTASYTSGWIFDKDLGIAEHLRDESGIVRYDTPIRGALKYHILQTQADEEMRLLYVALTRAKERLYVVSTVSHREEKCRLYSQMSQYLSFSCFLNHHNYFSWMMMALAQKQGAEQPFEILFCDTPDATLEASAAPKENEQGEASSLVEAEADRAYDFFKKRFDYHYHDEFLTKIPSKFSTTALYPAILDDVLEGVEPLAAQESSLLDAPSFLSVAPQKATAAQRGTATHVFLQFCDFSYLQRYGTEAEIARLQKQSFLNADIASLIEHDKIDGFLRSEFFLRVWQKAKKVHREIRFNIEIPANEFASDPSHRHALEGETVFVQGVIDCILQTEDGYLLLDYKTDSFSEVLLQDRERVATILKNRHRQQISYYARACEQLLGERVKHAYIYSFALQDLVEIPLLRIGNAE